MSMKGGRPIPTALFPGIRKTPLGCGIMATATTRLNKLTLKQKTFAKMVAMGMPKRAVYDQVYGSRGGKSVSGRQIQASQLAAKPHVQAEIDRQMNRTLLRDTQTEMDDCLRNMRELAQDSPDHKVRVVATKALYEMLERRQERELAASRVAQLPPPSEPQPNLEQLVNDLIALRESQRGARVIDLEPVDDSAPTET
jgi:hypothetical protein